MKISSAFASGVVSAALGDDGSLWIWGKSKRGQLGLGKDVTEAVIPSRVQALEGEKIVKVGWLVFSSTFDIPKTYQKKEKSTSSCTAISNLLESLI